MKKFTHLFAQSGSLKRLVFQRAPEAQPEGQKTSKPKTGVDYYQEERQRFLNQLQRHAEGKVDYPGKGKNPEADKAHQARATEFIGKVQTEAQDLSDKKDNLEAGVLKKNQDALRALQSKFGEMRVGKSEGPTVSPEVQKKLDNYKVALSAFRTELEN